MITEMSLQDPYTMNACPLYYNSESHFTVVHTKALNISMDYLPANSRFMMSPGKTPEVQRGDFFLNHVLKNGDSYHKKGRSFKRSRTQVACLFGGGGEASRIAVRFSYRAEEWYKSETVHYFYICLTTISAQWGE